ncbi:exodeoxyribonuclease V, gamma subunit [Leptospira fainei serovar Hurstbridge str. BUT 6]|uniref:Exodeoxyribonuclease V, gamma subunit n=1 Tax=Leptospira fainei serovar Hurstbridge str. BUT 6 TaxID=1193011 RepID=S3V8G2_9LEPT|nr:exodeoxyribonuclease V subunit gamma [Leptospira fainei]EPG72705.1 exodeoxyribonuclease V, gamma subunit [Leptospira fainei serovar Hurstbridge str. BUT 6]
MPINVFSSDDLSLLTENLLSSVSSDIRKEDGLYSPIIVIPNQSMETWLYLEFVKRAGIVFNIRFLFLEKAIEEFLLKKYSPDSNPTSRPFLKPESRRFLIYEYILKKPSFLSDYPILSAYLLPSGRKNIDPVRLFELSGRLAKYFKDYELQRQDWIRNWIGNPYEMLRLGTEDIEEWNATKSPVFFLQKELYAATAESASTETLIQFAMRTRSLAKTANAKSKPGKLYLFGLSQLSSTYIALFNELLPEISVEVFQFGPPRDTLVTDASELTACRSWATPFRTLHQSWLSSGAQIHTIQDRAKKRESVLEAFQTYLLSGKQALSDRGLPADESLIIAEAPGKLREVESVFQVILSKLDVDPTLRLTDIGIFCVNLPDYRPAIESIFEGGILAKLRNASGKEEFTPKTLPYTIRDVRAGDASSFLRGLLCIFPLLAGKRSRQEFFDLFRNSCFQAKWNIDPETVQEWKIYAKNLNLYIDDSLEGRPQSFSFRNGFIRLAMSEVLPESAEEGTGISPYPSQNKISVENWIGIWKKVESLLNSFCNRLLNPSLSSDELLDSFLRFVQAMLVPAEEEPEETAIALELFTRLESLKGVSWDSGDAKDRIRFFETFVRESCDGIPVRKGKYLTGGITVSALQPMRPIPFRHIFILGLGEGAFPGIDDRSAFNLRHLSPRIGDITTRQTNESLLYETILSAKESLNFSFVSQDTGKDEELAPSPSLLQIEQALKEFILDPDESVRITLPLNKHSKQYFEARAVSHERDFRIPFFKTYDASAVTAYGQEEGKKEYVKKILNFGTVSQSAQSLSAIGKELTIDLTELMQFWRSPLFYFLRKNFGLFVQDFEEEESISQREPFRISESFSLISETWKIFGKKFSGKKIPDDSLPLFLQGYERTIQNFGKRGLLPRGTYRDVEEILNAEKFERSWVKIGPMINQSRFYDALSFGETTKQGTILSLPNPYLDISEGIRVRFSGLKESIFVSDENANMVLIYPNLKKNLKNGIEPLLIQSLLDLLPEESKKQKTVQALFGYISKEGAPEAYQLQSESSERKNFLKDLVEEYLRPCTALLSPQFWEDFPLRKEITQNMKKEDRERLSHEYSLWIRETLEYDLSEYLNPTLRLLPSPKDHIPANALDLSEKLYEPVLRSLS